MFQIIKNSIINKINGVVSKNRQRTWKDSDYEWDGSGYLVLRKLPEMSKEEIDDLNRYAVDINQL